MCFLGGRAEGGLDLKQTSQQKTMSSSVACLIDFVGFVYMAGHFFFSMDRENDSQKGKTTSQTCFE